MKKKDRYPEAKHHIDASAVSVSGNDPAFCSGRYGGGASSRS